MPNFLSADFAWWLTAVQVPVLAGLFRLVQQARARSDVAERGFNDRLAGIRDDLAAYKLEVARTYASLVHLKEVETRLTEHLLRIEAKLDQAHGAIRGRT